MLKYDTLFGPIDKVQIAIDRIRQFEPPEGYYVAFSGGKDSQTVYHLCKEAGVKFDAHYHLTTVDPPELVRFIKQNYPKVVVDRPPTTMWKLIVDRKIPPTRIARYCCQVLKEGGGEGRFVITGVRWAESVKRKNNRGVVEIFGNKTKDKKIFLNSDNDEVRRVIETCVTRGKRILNPIVDWTDSDVWEYLNGRKIDHCQLYDQGFKRLGCIGCQMAPFSHRQDEFKRWPKYYQNYLLTFERMLKERERRGLPNARWKTAQDVMDWWIYEMPREDPDQNSLFTDYEAS
ncbi:phosphoadenosine phosphosulfate reductase [Hydrogenispora ethanolica]|uniref:Phosphoadenosine phosphosulfate reductase n=1 Tax=Hydrogenispora ethanolica TaxID=1082276 RepID=A0A4R1S5B5_HYDET|nr:phosphoadenosine phosphosulfate reductase family protein [Hydrogenispora ethanolica]TCL74214.1 phosphoadenosine phosphosulfate reductase [Hydrogenispora ethanolica]